MYFLDPKQEKAISNTILIVHRIVRRFIEYVRRLTRVYNFRSSIRQVFSDDVTYLFSNTTHNVFKLAILYLRFILGIYWIKNQTCDLLIKIIKHP